MSTKKDCGKRDWVIYSWDGRWISRTLGFTNSLKNAWKTSYLSAKQYTASNRWTIGVNVNKMAGPMRIKEAEIVEILKQ